MRIQSFVRQDSRVKMTSIFYYEKKKDGYDLNCKIKSIGLEAKAQCLIKLGFQGGGRKSRKDATASEPQ